MDHIGTFQSKRWGTVNVLRATYDSLTGPTAVVLQTENGERLATLSINMYWPDCSHDSKDLPDDCFYVKTYADLEELAVEAMAGGLFVPRVDLPHAESGLITAPVWQIKS